MNAQHSKLSTSTETLQESQRRLWPSSAYTEQLAQLKKSIGENVFLVELRPTEINMGIRLTGKSYELLAVLDYPRPDPVKGLSPHIILLDDGRGINLGRIARISVITSFNPPPQNILYQDDYLMQNLLLREHTYDEALFARKTKAILGRLLGK